MHEELIVAYQSGASIHELAGRFHLGKSKIRKILDEAGVLRTRAEGIALGWIKRPFDERSFVPRVGKTIDRSEVLKLHSEGMNPNEIGSKLSVDSRRVRDLLKTEGLSGVYNRTCRFCGELFSVQGNNQKTCEGCVPAEEPIFAGRAVKYGVTKKIWDQILSSQGGHCALCPREPSRVDHDHQTGRVRGLVCNGCNFALSRVDEDRSWIERASVYTAVV